MSNSLARAVGPVHAQAVSKKEQNQMTEPEVLTFFRTSHLPPILAAISQPFADVAAHILPLPDFGQRGVSLQLLLQAKDAAVRAAL
jgi:hypothetical protein